ncbi:MAG: cation transporter, partial [Gammaproteobacteria bacterium]
MNQAMAQSDGTGADEPLRLKIAGMDCGSCAMTIESSMRQLRGVADVCVSFTTETLEVSGDVDPADIEHRLRELGYRIADEDAGARARVMERHGLTGFLNFLWSQAPLRSTLLVAAAMIAGIVTIPLMDIGPVAGIPALSLLFGAAVLVAGAPVFIKGFRSLIFARRITIDLLMAIAAIGAIGIGETGEAATVVLLFMLGEALEAYSAERARDSLRSLMSLQPEEATVLEAHAAGHDHGHAEEHGHAQAPDTAGHEHHHDHDHGEPCTGGDHGGHGAGDAAHEHQVIKPVEEVQVGDRVLVRPAQRIPVDGEVVRGVSSVNQAPVTGEDVPVLKAAGDDVMAGTVNGEAALEIVVARPSSEGTIARIAKLVEQAQAQRSPAERFIDRFARYYTPAVVLLALLVVAIPVLGFGQPFLETADGTRGWM